MVTSYEGQKKRLIPIEIQLERIAKEAKYVGDMREEEPCLEMCEDCKCPQAELVIDYMNPVKS